MRAPHDNSAFYGLRVLSHIAACADNSGSEVQDEMTDWITSLWLRLSFFSEPCGVRSKASQGWRISLVHDREKRRVWTKMQWVKRKILTSTFDPLHHWKVFIIAKPFSKVTPSLHIWVKSQLFCALIHIILTCMQKLLNVWVWSSWSCI